MLYLKRFLSSMGILFSSILLLLIIYTLLSYFEIVNSAAVLSGILVFSLFVSSFYLGTFATKKGYLEGLKLGGAYSLITLFLFFFFKPVWSIKMVIYYVIVLLTCSLGSILGINKKRKN